LFHRGLIVCESDTDRAFYDEINRRLVDVNRGIADSHFVNAQNMQTEFRIVGPMRKLGIPAVALADLDFLNSNGTEWNNLIKACGIPEEVNERVKPERDYLKGKFQSMARGANDPDPIKRGGISKLDAQDKPRLISLLDELGKYGLFLVPTGELESFLAGLHVSGKGTDWLISMFTKLGDTEEQTDFVKPATGDVWDFLDKIAKWISDPNKLGI
jgi:hypothetical protein